MVAILMAYEGCPTAPFLYLEFRQYIVRRRRRTPVQRDWLAEEGDSALTSGNPQKT